MSTGEEDFRVEIERRFKRSAANQLFIFPKKYVSRTLCSSSDSSIEDMSDVSVYDLRIQNFEKELKENREKSNYIDSIFEAASGFRKDSTNKKNKSERCATVGVSSSSKNLREIRAKEKTVFPSHKKNELQRLIQAQLSKKPFN